MPEMKPIVPQIKGERLANRSEIALWNRAMEIRQRINRNIYVSTLYYRNLVILHQFSQSKGISIPVLDQMPDLEKRLYSVHVDFDYLSKSMDRVLNRTAGIRKTGNDLDILDPGQGFGWIIQVVALGVLLVGTLISRLITVESESQDVSDKLNSVLDSADKLLCSADPNSQTCQDWKQEKIKSDYVHNMSLVDTVKGALTTAGKGLGVGIAVAVPLLIAAMFWRR
jgi:hypothetical protein